MIGIISFLLIWGPIVIPSVIFASAFYAYAKRDRDYAYLEKWCKKLFAAALVFRVIDAGLKTLGQYLTWSKDGLSEHLLHTPLSSKIPTIFNHIGIFTKNNLGYFLYYSFSRFWLNILIALVFAIIFYALLKGLKKYKDGFFEGGELELGLLCAFLAGWPNVVLFIPGTFVFIILLSIIHMAFLKKKYTTIGVPLLISAAACLLWGSKLIIVLHLSVLGT